MGKAGREGRLMPGGVPRWVRCYDNGGESLDRYTVVYSGNFAGRGGRCMYVSMNAAPSWPQGICQHGEHDRVVDAPRGGFAPAVGRKCHLGVRVRFQDLPADCQEVVLRDYRGLWGL